MGLFNFERSENGRKYNMGILFAFLILASAGFCTMNPILSKVFVELVSGIVAIYNVYCGGNVAASGVFNWKNKTKEDKPEDLSS